MTTFIFLRYIIKYFVICKTISETATRKKEEEEKVSEPGPIHPLEEGMVHCAVPLPEEEHLEGCHKLVADVHGANV